MKVTRLGYRTTKDAALFVLTNDFIYREFNETGAPKVNFRRIYVWRKTNICCKISCLPASPRIFEHLKTGIIAHF